jgi:hypothetical protein
VIEQVTSDPAGGSSADLGRAVTVSHRYTNGTTGDARLHLQALTGGQPTPGSAPAESVAHAPGTGSGRVTLTVTGTAPVAADGLRAELRLDEITVPAAVTVPVTLSFGPPAGLPGTVNGPGTVRTRSGRQATSGDSIYVHC